MKRPNGLAVLLCLTTLIAPSAVARAQDVGPSSRVARFIDPQTVAVVRIDLDRLELPTAEVLFRDVPLEEADRGRMQAVIELGRQAVAAWKQLGASEAFYIISLADLPGGGGFLVLPGAAPAPGADLPEELQQLGGCQVVAGALVCANRETIARLKAQTDGRTLPAAAFEAISDSPLQLVIAPSDDHRRVLRETTPRLPAEWGGLTGQTLADGLVWAAVGARLSPQLAARVVVQSQDAAAAARLQEALKGGLAALARGPQARQLLPDIDRAIGALTPAVENDRLVLSLSTEDPLVRAVMAQASRLAGVAQQAADRNQSRNNLKQFGLALHNFHDVYASFPPTASYDANGKKLLSWRVYVLPYLDAFPLYQEFRLDEPWDSEHNKKLIAKMPAVFASPESGPAAEGKTRIVAPVGETTIFTGGKEGIPIREITDGASQTIMLIEVPPENAVVWTKPDDWEVNLDEPLKGLFPEGREGMQALLADGAVRSLSRMVDAEILRRLFSRNDGEPVGEF